MDERKKIKIRLSVTIVSRFNTFRVDTVVQSEYKLDTNIIKNVFHEPERLRLKGVVFY